MQKLSFVEMEEVQGAWSWTDLAVGTACSGTVVLAATGLGLPFAFVSGQWCVAGIIGYASGAIK